MSRTTVPHLAQRGAMPIAAGPAALRRWDDRTAGRGPLALLLAAPAAILVATMAIMSRDDLAMIGRDLTVYAGYADRLLSGAIPYRAFHLEYPPLALLPMLLPRLATGTGATDPAAYAWAFTIIEALLAVVGGWIVVKVAERQLVAAGTWALLVLSACVSIAWRYDLWPAVLVLAAVVAMDDDRPATAGIAIAIGTMMKLFPIVVLPVLAARAVAQGDLSAVRRLVVAASAVIGVVVLISVWLAGPNAFQWVAYQLDRGLQLETTGAGVLLLGHALGGMPLSIVNAFESMQVQSAGADALAAVASLLELALVAIATGAAFVRFRRDVDRHGSVPLSSLAQGSMAVIIATLVASKVFSAQYVVWFLPLVPFIPAPKRALALAISGLSTVIYPLNYTALWQLQPAMAVVLNVRNVLLGALLVWLLASLCRVPEESAPDGRRQPRWRVLSRA